MSADVLNEVDQSCNRGAAAAGFGITSRWHSAAGVAVGCWYAFVFLVEFRLQIRFKQQGNTKIQARTRIPLPAFQLLVARVMYVVCFGLTAY